MEEIRQNIRDFKQSSGVDKVVVLWTANTERFSEVREGINDTAETFLRSIENNEAEVAPSSIFAAACIQEGAPSFPAPLYTLKKIFSARQPLFLIRKICPNLFGCLATKGRLGRDLEFIKPIQQQCI